MTNAPESLTNSPGAAERGDVLSSVLAAVRLRGGLLLRAELRQPWAIRPLDVPRLKAVIGVGPSRQLFTFHIVTRGACWVRRSGGEPRQLQAGEAVLLPHGDSHTLGDGRDVPVLSAERAMPPPPWDEAPLVRSGGGGRETRLVCGFFVSDQSLLGTLGAPLPRTICIRPDAGPAGRWLAANIRFISHEAWSGRPGAQGMLARLFELMFVEILREQMARLPEGATGWLAALRDPVVGRCLERLHGAPQRDWRMPALAEELCVSPSQLAERFKRLIGLPPGRYLTRWRMQLAQRALRESAAPLSRVAETVGYGSEAAFTRAFKREVGTTPAAWRASADGASG